MPPCERHHAIACSGSSQVENGTHALPCLRRLNRSSSAAATVRPSTTSAAAGSWNTALTPSTRTAKHFSGPARAQTFDVEHGARTASRRGNVAPMAESESKTTTDHDEIRRWAEERGGRPATVEGTEGGGEDAGVLRIDFP